jgi:diguanylate cyclase (GGDEF)-like protein
MELQYASVALCAMALPLFVYVQFSRRDARLQGWVGFWTALLAQSAVLAANPAPGSWLLRSAGACGVAAAAMLLFSARRLLGEARPQAIDYRWRYLFWALTALAMGLTLAPAPWSAGAGWVLAAVLAVAAALFWMLGPWPHRLLGLAAAFWGLTLAPHYPFPLPAAVLAPLFFSWAMLWLICHRAAAPSLAAPAPEQLQLFRQSVRRSREFEILTHIGTALSASLDADALLQTIHTQLQKLMDVRSFYVAFQDLELDEIRFAFEVEDGVRVPPRSRPRGNALTEHVIATGQSLLISRDVTGYIQDHGLALSGKPAKNWMGVPVMLQGQPCGVIAVQSSDRDDAYDTEHLHVLEILASQAGVALDNARLFAEVQRDAGQKTFLNHIARLTISTLSPPEMLANVVAESARAFHYDHIAVAIIRPAAEFDDHPELEVAAVAGAHPGVLLARRRLPLGEGLAGRAAETGETQQVSSSANRDWAVCPEARSGVALPIRYAGQTLGVLHLESHAPNGFPADQVMVLQTLTDQIAVALNHANLFQQLQHQAITDSLTGLKTRRFFMEALQAEWRRARAASLEGGEAGFAIVLVDLNEFKPLNDRFGHLEGDRILVRVARLLEQKSRASSVVARYGGDEFIILVPACQPEVARLLPQRLQSALDEDPVLVQRGVRGSFGLAVYPDAGASPEDLLHAADAAMYRSKQSGQRGRAGLESPAFVETERAVLPQ